MVFSTANRRDTPRSPTTSRGARSSPWSRPVRSRRSIGSYAQGSSILAALFKSVFLLPIRGIPCAGFGYGGKRKFWCFRPAYVTSSDTIAL
jgi:hypothetical protein